MRMKSFKFTSPIASVTVECLMLTTLNDEQIELVLKLLELVGGVASHYDEEDKYELGVIGLIRGLNNYKDNKRQHINILAYVSYFIKIGIEGDEILPASRERLGPPKKETPPSLSGKAGPNPSDHTPKS